MVPSPVPRIELPPPPPPQVVKKTAAEKVRSISNKREKLLTAWGG
jgi:hypothetical protein